MMTEKEIRHLAYRLKTNKEDNGTGAIVVIGAGASVTGNMPLATAITSDIKDKHPESPEIKDLHKDKSNDYYSLMSCITAKQRKDLFKSYIDKSRINASHIYLSKLMAEGYVDYILTVNFDDLVLKSLALHNLFPATYDIATLKGLTTARFDYPGVVYLHGRYNGFNLINTEEEFKEVRGLIIDSLNKLEDRPWIVVGYGATDPVFDYIKDLKKFESNLYWVCYKENDPPKNVTDFLSDSSYNAYAVKGYDADEFFVELHTELEIEDSTFIAKPFTHMKNIHDSLVDIKLEGSKTERFEVTKRWVDDAIKKYEQQESSNESDSEIQLDNIKLEIQTTIIKGQYDKLPDLEEKYTDHLESLRDLLSVGYNNWAADIFQQNVNNEAVDKKPMFKESIEKCQKSIEINPFNYYAYNTWASALQNLAILLPLEEGKPLFLESFAKYQKSIELKPNYSEAYMNWANALQKFAILLPLEKGKQLFLESFGKYQKGAELNPNNYIVYFNWGIALQNLAGLLPIEEGEKYFRESFDKYQKSIELNSMNSPAYANWANSIITLYHLVEEGKRELLEEAKKVAELTIKHSGNKYNLSCVYALMNDKEKAFDILEEVLEKGAIQFSHVEADNDWEHLREEEEYKKLKAKYLS